MAKLLRTRRPVQGRARPCTSLSNSASAARSFALLSQSPATPHPLHTSSRSPVSGPTNPGAGILTNSPIIWPHRPIGVALRPFRAGRLRGNGAPDFSESRTRTSEPVVRHVATHSLGRSPYATYLLAGPRLSGRCANTDITVYVHAVIVSTTTRDRGVHHTTPHGTCPTLSVTCVPTPQHTRHRSFLLQAPVAPRLGILKPVAREFPGR